MIYMCCQDCLLTLRSVRLLCCQSLLCCQFLGPACLVNATCPQRPLALKLEPTSNRSCQAVLQVRERAVRDGLSRARRRTPQGTRASGALRNALHGLGAGSILHIRVASVCNSVLSSN